MSNNLNLCKDPIGIDLICAQNYRGTRFSFRQIVETVNTWMARSRQRQELARLDRRLLNDIGLDDTDVELETSKPFWIE